MNIIESIKIAFQALVINKMRSLLTMLGIIIGISSVIAVVAIGNSGEAAIRSEFESFGVNRIYIGYNWHEDILSSDILTHEDIDGIERAFDDSIKAISSSYSEYADVSKNTNRNTTNSVRLHGVNDQFDDIVHIEIKHGRFLSPSDVDSLRSVAVIDEKLAVEVFGRSNVIGERIHLKSRNQNVSFVVTGVYESPKSLFSSMGSGDQPTTSYVPISTVESMYGVGNRVWGVEINLNEGVDTNKTIDDMIKYLQRRKGNGEKVKYRGYSAEGEMEIVNNVTGVITAIVSAIAAISLLVGGIGVMNIMLVSVTERTREIGIRKALGARHKDVMVQFLVEAVIISTIGGVIGTILGVGLSVIVASIIKVPPQVDIMVICGAWLFSAIVGITFGLYPANKAAKLDPIDALRYE